MNKVMTVFKMPLTTKIGVQVSIDKRLLKGFFYCLNKLFCRPAFYSFRFLLSLQHPFNQSLASALPVSKISGKIPMKNGGTVLFFNYGWILKKNYVKGKRIK